MVAEDEYDDVGYLRAEAFTGRKAFPVPNTVVTITRQRKDGSTELVRILTTDENGSTATIEVPAPSRDLSMSPGNITPYAVYNVQFDHPYYYTIKGIDEQIFAGETAIVKEDLIPLPEQADRRSSRSYTVTEHNKIGS